MININDRSTAPDIAIFAENCVFMRSIYLHAKTLFELSSAEDKDRMARTANTLFGDLNRMFVEYMILLVCKITDPAKDAHNNDNHSVAFLLQHYDFSDDSATTKRLVNLADRLHAFRKKVIGARNKVISHSDREAIRAGRPLGAAPDGDWNEFWLDLQEFVCIVHEKVLGTSFYINGVAMLSDADGLLKALKHADCFDELIKDPALTQRCADLALR
jgi:hypothetical protein